MNACSLDLRLKVLDAVECGIPRREVVKTFGVSMPTIERYLRRRRPKVKGILCRTGDRTREALLGAGPNIAATTPHHSP